MIFASTSFQPGWIFKHGQPPFLEHAFHSLPNIVWTYRVDQRPGVRTRENDALFADDVTLNDPVTAAFIQVKLSFVYGRARRTVRVMTADVSFWNI